MNDILCAVCKQRFGSHWQSATTNMVYCPINHPDKWELAQPNTTYVSVEPMMVSASEVWRNTSMQAKKELVKGLETDGAIKLRNDMDNARHGTKMSPKQWLSVDFDLTVGMPRQKLADKWNAYNPTWQMTSISIDDVVIQIDKEGNQ